MSSADARYCEHLTCRHARTFALASYLLPAEKRRGTFALYAFCRVADDIVDAPSAQSDPAAAHRALDTLRRALDSSVSGHPHDPVFRELAWAIRRFAVPREALHELVDGVERDLTINRWQSFEELREYAEGVAGCVGAMCVAVMGVSDADGRRTEAVRHARAMGVAMQLTNVLRDVGEDAARGRVYLPLDELAAHGFDAAAVLDGSALQRRPAWRRFMREQVGRARLWYGCAMPGIALLEPDAQKCAAACAVGYARILDVIERNDYDCFTQRASLGWGERAMLVGRYFFGAAPETPTAVSAA